MSEFDRTDPLVTALEELAALGGPDDRAALDRVRDRLRERRLRVLIAGEAKRGKSTLVNALADNTSEAEAALDTMDAAVLVLTADSPVSASERELMIRSRACRSPCLWSSTRRTT